MLTHSCNTQSYQRPKTSNHKKKVTLAEPVKAKDRLLNLASAHSERNDFCATGPAKQLNEKNNGNNAKILEELKPSISTSSFSTAFSSNSTYSSTTNYSSDDTSTTESNSSSDIEKYKVCPHIGNYSSCLAKTTARPSKETKSCDPNGNIAAPSKFKARLMPTEHGSQKTSFSITSLDAESCDPLVENSGPSVFREGALDNELSRPDKVKCHTKNDCLSNIGCSLSGESTSYGKIDKSCHVNEKKYYSDSVINEPSKESVTSKKINCSSPEVGNLVPPHSNIPKEAKDVDNSVLNFVGDHGSRQSQGEAQKKSILSRPSTKKADCTISFPDPSSNHRSSSASNGDGTVHCVKGDNSCQHFDVSQSQRAKSSFLFAKMDEPALNSFECTKQSMKSKLVRSLPPSSHGTSSFIDNRAKIGSRVENVGIVKSNINVATSDKSYSCGDYCQPSKLSRYHGDDEKGVQKVVYPLNL